MRNIIIAAFVATLVTAANIHIWGKINHVNIDWLSSTFFQVPWWVSLLNLVLAPVAFFGTMLALGEDAGSESE